MALSDAMRAAHENLLRVLRPLTPTEVDDRVRRGLDVPSVAPDVDPAALHDGARRFVDALSADPAAAAELTRRGMLCATLTGKGTQYLTAKTVAHKALRKWKPSETILQHLVNQFQHQGGRELVADVRHEYERLDHLLGFTEVPKAARALLEAWRDAAWSIVSKGENDSLDGCYWLLHADKLQYAFFVPAAAPQVRRAADGLLRWLEAEILHTKRRVRVEWKVAQSLMLSRLKNGTLPKSIRDAAGVIGKTYSTTHKAVHNTDSLKTYFGLSVETVKPSPGKLLEELTSQADAHTRRYLETLSQDTRQQVETQLRDMPAGNRLELLKTLATSPDAGSCGDMPLRDDD